MKLSDRPCARCGCPFPLRCATDTKRWCSKVCAKRDRDDAVMRGRAEAFHQAIPVGADVIEIPLTQGQVALVDIGDAGNVARFSWHAVNRGGNWYARTNMRDDGGKRVTAYMHQVVMSVAPSVEIDHRNGNGLDNRRLNLRHATRAQNQANRHRVSGASGTKGVYWHKRDQVWQAALAGKHLGYFTDKAAAEAAYRAAAQAAYGEFACQK